jgi:PAS domain-containing protein
MDIAALASPDLVDLANPNSLTRLLLDRMTEGVSLSREDGTIVYTNPAEDALFGHEPGELWGQRMAVRSAYRPERTNASSPRSWTD